MNKLLIQGAQAVNEGKIATQDILIEGERISKIDPEIEVSKEVEVIDERGKYLSLIHIS